MEWHLLGVLASKIASDFDIFSLKPGWISYLVISYPMFYQRKSWCLGNFLGRKKSSAALQCTASGIIHLKQVRICNQGKSKMCYKTVCLMAANPPHGCQPSGSFKWNEESIFRLTILTLLATAWYSDAIWLICAWSWSLTDLRVSRSLSACTEKTGQAVVTVDATVIWYVWYLAWRQIVHAYYWSGKI